ncbi:MAG: serine/threonine-protein phosphatase, partial [Acidobacteria bacterium]|nr:serine/threonine-protein phosphatase [Acidobacteriota bacterium]
ARIQALAETADELELTASRLNRMIKDVCPANRFITCFLGVLDPHSGELVWVNAGHEPGIILRHYGATERLGAGGPPLGVFRDSEHKASRSVLEPGDRLLLVTDGVTEARGPGGEDFGLKRVESLLVELFNRRAEDVVQELSRAVDRWTGAESPHDDVTIVALRREGR